MFYENKMKIKNQIYKIQAKIYDEASEYGINDGRISKLWIWPDEQFQTIYCFDRGEESINLQYVDAIEQIKENLLKIFN